MSELTSAIVGQADVANLMSTRALRPYRSAGARRRAGDLPGQAGEEIGRLAKARLRRAHHSSSRPKIGGHASLCPPYSARQLPLNEL